MISTAILMKIGADRTSVRPASTDRETAGGISFAQSFDERVGSTVEMLEDGPTGGIATVLQSSKEDPPVKIANEVFAVLPEVKGKTVAAGTAPQHADTGEGPTNGETVQLQKVAVLGVQARNMVGDSEKNVQSPLDAELTTESRFAVAQDSKKSNFKNDVFLPQVKADERLLSPSSEEIVVQKGTKSISSTSGTVTVKKNAKSQQDKATLPALQKVTSEPHLIAIDGGPASTTVVQNSDHFMIGHAIEAFRTSAAVESAVPKGEPNKTSDGDVGDSVSATAKSFLIGVTPTKDSLVQKDSSGENLPKVDVEIASPVTADQVGSTKHGAEAEKLLSAVTPTSADRDGHPNSASEFAITVAHAMVGNSVFVSGIGAPSTSSVPSEASAMKMASGESSHHVTGVPMGSGEQDNLGGVTTSPDRVPQMLTATPTALEVGIQNGTHGWLKVRAEMTDTGTVNASVSASSTIGQEMLHKELPSLTAYLQSEKVVVNTVIIHATSTESRGITTGMDSESGGQTQYGGDDGRGGHKGVAEMALDGADEVASYESLDAVDDNGALPLAKYVGGGSWLSIRA
jgi:hypothetical protein